MNTPSHFLMTAAARKALPGREIPRSAAWLGAIAPDVPLYLLFILGLFWFRTIQGMEFDAIWTLMWREDGLYFNDPWWKGLHNFFHTPPVILTGLVLGRAISGLRPDLGRWLTWFFLACLLHCGIDILTHNDDGPLLFWPFDWQTRFSSPVSYWDPNHYGRPFALFELVFDVALTSYLVGPWLKKRLSEGGISPR